MQDVNLPDWLAWLLAAGGISVAVWNIDRLARYVGVDNLMKRVLHAAFEPLTDMIADRVQTQIDHSTHRIWLELRPNHTTSLRDAVDRTEQAVNRLQSTVDDHVNDVEAHASDPTAHIRPSSPDDGVAGPR